MANTWWKWRDLTGVIYTYKIPTKMKLLIYQTVIRPSLLYGCEIRPISVNDEKCMTTTVMRMVRWTMRVGLLEHRGDLGGSKVGPIVMVMRRRRLEWFGQVRRRDGIENIKAVVEMKMVGKCPGGRPKLQLKDTVGLRP